MVSAARRGTTLAVLALLVLSAGTAYAQSFPRILEEIRMTVAEGRELVLFRFSQPFEGDPKQEHQSGQFRLNFFGTGSPVPVRSFKVNDSQFVQEIRIQQNQYSTTVTFVLQKSSTNLKDRLAFSRRGKVLQLALDTKQPPEVQSGTETPERDLLVEMTDKIVGKTGAQDKAAAGAEPGAKSPQGAPETQPQEPLGQFSGVDWLPAMMTLAITLAMIVVGLYAVLYLYNRFIASRISRTNSSQMIRQVASFHLAPKQRVVILEIQGERIACGVTPSQITFLTKLGGTGSTQGRKPLPRAAPPAPEARDAPKNKPKTPASSDPMQQFADALKEKVGSMKRLK